MEMVMYLLFVVFGLVSIYFGRLEDDLIFTVAGSLLLIIAGVSTSVTGIASSSSFVVNNTGTTIVVSPSLDTSWYVDALSLLWVLSGAFGFIYYVFQKIQSLGEEADGEEK